jgi:hypothetical protein
VAAFHLKVKGELGTSVWLAVGAVKFEGAKTGATGSYLKLLPESLETPDPFVTMAFQ